MKLSNGALVAVLDGEKLVLFKNTDATGITLSAIDTPALEERASGSPGRRSTGGNPDDDTQAEDGFAMSVAEVLNKWAVTGKVDELLVIAAPKTLGELRKHWHKELQAKLVGEIAKALTGHSTDQIAAAIDKA